MKILDCETIDSTYSSIEQILGYDRKKLNDFFDKYDVLNDVNVKLMSSEKRIYKALKAKLKTTTFSCDGLYWFHLTRTSQGEQFTDGLLPLPNAIKRLWPLLYTLSNNFSIKEWGAFIKHAETNDIGISMTRYKKKLKDKNHWGPYAIMVRETAFLNFNHYLEKPEIVEDICNEFTKKYKIDLLKAFQENTKPCIVKFFDENFKEEYLGIALNYLYRSHKKICLADTCDYCFNGKGVGVPYKKIINIEFNPQSEMLRALAKPNTAPRQIF